MPLTLSLREQPTVPLEAEGLSPDRLAGLRRAEVEAHPVWHGNRRAQLADFFTVSGDGDEATCGSRATCGASSSSGRA